jgi:hypothetical protein
MVDYLALSALVVAICGALATLHIKKIKIFGGCVESDCVQKKVKSPPETPSEPAEEKEEEIVLPKPSPRTHKKYITRSVAHSKEEQKTCETEDNGKLETEI